MDSNQTKPLSALGLALKNHDAKEITRLGAEGQTLYPEETPAELFATGFNWRDLDQAHSQSVPRIKSSVSAAIDAGIDVNKPVNGEPAAHFLTRRYVERQAAHEYDSSIQATHGMTDGDHMKYLEAYAASGVDFSQRDAEGRGFLAAGEDALTAYASAKAPQTMKPDYAPAYDGDRPSFASVKRDVMQDLKDIKRTAQTAEFGRQAQEKIATRPAPSQAATKDRDVEL